VISANAKNEENGSHGSACRARMRQKQSNNSAENGSALHGSIVNGERIVREPFLLVPKKSSTTSYGAALMLTSLLIKERPNAEFLLIVPTQQK
jgi:hypothetical protein